MPEPLPEAAPAEEPAATSVEVNAPGNQSEVESGSTQEAVVPASRFNGLMSAFNKEKADKESLLNELAALRSAPKETPKVSDELSAEVQALRQELREERLKSAKTKILDDFPEAKEFADLFVSDSPEEMRSLAEDISNRVKRITTPQKETTTEVVPAAVQTQEVTPVTEPTVTAGGATIPSGAATDERIDNAIQKRSWTDYLSAKWDRLGESGGLENVEATA